MADAAPAPERVTVHRAEPAGGVAGLGHDLRTLAADAAGGRYLAWRLFRRDLSAEYDRAWFGWLWNFADPLVLAAVFVFLRRGDAVSALDAQVPYPVWVVLGMLTLQAFLNALNQPLVLLKKSRAMRNQVRVPAATLVLSQLLRQGFDAAFALPIMAAVIFAYGEWTAGGLVAAALCYAALVVAGFALGVLLAPLNAVFLDVSKAVRAANRPLLFLCPTFWYAAAGAHGGPLGLLTALNPLAWGMNRLRLAAVGEYAAGSALAAAAGALGIATLALAVATLLLHRMLPVLAARE